MQPRRHGERGGITEIRRIGGDELTDYARIPIAFRVDGVVEAKRDGEGFVLVERSVDVPWVKDYDSIPGERPTDWPLRFDMSKWGLFAAWREGVQAGGAAVAPNAAELGMEQGCRVSAVLWDIRVLPELRGLGIGTALFRVTESWARAQGCRALLIETQNINAPACRFYARMECVLRSIDQDYYPGLPGESRLIWQKPLTGLR